MRELVEHRIGHLLDGKKLVPIPGVPQSEQDSLTAVDIESCPLFRYRYLKCGQVPGSLTKEVLLIRIEFGQLSHFPPPSPHDRLHQGRNLPEGMQRIFLAGEILQVRVRNYEGIVLRHDAGDVVHFSLAGGPLTHASRESPSNVERRQKKTGRREEKGKSEYKTLS